MTYNNNRILAIIPARKGSKGIKNKNIKKIKNKTLVEWSIYHAKHSKYIDKIIITTDDEKIVEIGKLNKVDVIKRPDSLAKDITPMKDVILHALTTVKGYDIFVLLQPTSPLRANEDVDKTIEILCSGDYHSCVSICEFTPHPFLAVIKNNDILKKLFNNKQYSRRQDFPDVYRINGAIYTVNIQKFLKEPVFVKETNSTYYEMPVERSVDIDTIIDLKFAELMFNELTH